MITLQNQEVTAKIAELGAELKSLTCGGSEYIWEGKPEVWGASCPLMFPICGGLKEDRYTLDGKEYTLGKHGYARFKTFTLEKVTENSAVFLHCSDEETKKSFPFDYELRVIYTLNGKTLKIDYEVKNLTDRTMYFNIGSHEGYYTPEGIEDYDVIFDEKQTLISNVLYGNLLSYQELPILKDSAVLPLYDKYFTIDALVFKNIEASAATLRNRKTGRALRIDFPDAPHFLLWHKPNAPYICLEPWNGIQDRVGSSYELSEKESITVLVPNATYIFTHSMTVLA